MTEAQAKGAGAHPEHHCVLQSSAEGVGGRSFLAYLRLGQKTLRIALATGVTIGSSRFQTSAPPSKGRRDASEFWPGSPWVPEEEPKR
jgi:hypothetical protein